MPERVSARALTGVAAALIVALAAGRRRAARRRDDGYLPHIHVDTVDPAAAALRDAGLTVAVAESCTGGSLAALLTAVRGASDFMRGGVVAYSDDAKRDVLDVPAEVLDRHGAVSEETAHAMAAGVRRRMGADIGLSVTGLIGAPAEGKPPGLIYVAAVGPTSARIRRIEEATGAQAGRTAAVVEAVAACCEIVALTRASVRATDE